MKKIAPIILMAAMCGGCDDTPKAAEPVPSHKMFTDEDGNVVHCFKAESEWHYYVVAPSGSATVTNEVPYGKGQHRSDDVSSCRCKPEAVK